MGLAAAWAIGLQSARGDAAPVTFQRLFDIARSRNESIAVQEAVLEQRSEQAWQSVAPMLPQVNASALLLKQTALASALANQFSPENQVTLKVGATQSLFKGLRDFALVAKTQHLRDAQKFRRDAAMRVLVVDLAQALAALLLARHDVRLIEKEVGIQLKRLQEIRSFQSRGRNRQSELLALESAVATQEGLLDQARGALISATEQLNFVLGESTASHEIDEATFPEFTPLPVDLSDVPGTIERRPEVAAARSELDAAESAIGVTRGNHFPTADASANYYFDRPGLLSEVRWDVSLSASWVLFAGGAYASQQRQAQAEWKTQELQLTRTRRQVEQEIRSLFGLAQSSERQVGQMKRAMDFAEQAYANEQRSFRSGLATTAEVLQAQALWISAQRSFLRSKTGHKLDRIRYEAATGGWPATH